MAPGRAAAFTTGGKLLRTSEGTRPTGAPGTGGATVALASAAPADGPRISPAPHRPALGRLSHAGSLAALRPRRRSRPRQFALRRLLSRAGANEERSPLE